MSNFKRNSMILPVAICLMLLGMFAFQPGASHGAVIAQTDFTGRTVTGSTASTITWTTDGILDPGSLTAIDDAFSGDLAGLFNTGDAQGHFAPNLNVENEGPWSVDVPLLVTPGKIVTLSSVDLDWQQFNNSGVFQLTGYSVDWTVELSGSSSGVIDSVTSTGVFGISGIETLTFSPSLELTTAETYTLNIFAIGTSFPNGGNNTGLDALTLNGSVANAPLAPVPEPSTFLLLGLGALGFVRRTRRKQSSMRTQG